jgi:hypothetical protein
MELYTAPCGQSITKLTRTRKNPKFGYGQVQIKKLLDGGEPNNVLAVVNLLTREEQLKKRLQHLTIHLNEEPDYYPINDGKPVYFSSQWSQEDAYNQSVIERLKEHIFHAHFNLTSNDLIEGFFDLMLLRHGMSEESFDAFCQECNIVLLEAATQTNIVRDNTSELWVLAQLMTKFNPIMFAQFIELVRVKCINQNSTEQVTEIKTSIRYFAQALNFGYALPDQLFIARYMLDNYREVALYLTTPLDQLVIDFQAGKI